MAKTTPGLAALNITDTALFMTANTTMSRLAGENILITGDNSGIGLAAAQEFDRARASSAGCRSTIYGEEFVCTVTSQSGCSESV
jgi:NADPH:quinone reductase-like Zn-dependent oxidoreductase